MKIWILTGITAVAMVAHGQSVATVNGGRLVVSSAGGDRSVKVEVRGSTARLFGFPGLADGAAYAGLTGVTVQTGAGNDSVEVEGEAGQSFDVRVDTSSGQDKATVKWKILSGFGTPAANIALVGQAGAPRVALVEVESESNRAAVAVDTGVATEAVAKVSAGNASEFLRVSYAGNAPKTVVDLSANAGAMEVDVRGGGTAGSDELLYGIQQGRRGALTVNWSVNAGGGADKVEAKVSTPESLVTMTGSIAGGAGDDDVQVESAGFSTTSGLTFLGGAGADKLALLVNGRFQLSQTLQTRMLGGDGNDEVVLSTNVAIFGTGLPNDFVPLIDCGLGDDRFNAFGLIQGCEARL